MELIDGTSLEAIQTALERRPALADDAGWARQIASISTPRGRSSELRTVSR